MNRAKKRDVTWWGYSFANELLYLMCEDIIPRARWIEDHEQYDLIARMSQWSTPTGKISLLPMNMRSVHIYPHFKAAHWKIAAHMLKVMARLQGCHVKTVTCTARGRRHPWKY